MPSRKLLAALVVLIVGIGAQSASATTLQVFTDQPVSSAPFLGMGAQVDPYDTLKPSLVDWPLIEQRLDFMQPGIIRVVEPSYDYFAGFDASGEPTYHWNSNKMQMLMTILTWAKAHDVTVVLGDWLDPLVDGNAAVPIDFIGALRSVYGFTNIHYYNVMNEPNDEVPAISFNTWAGIMKTVSAEITQLGYGSWLQLVGPDNENSWDDDAPALTLDRTVGMDADNPLEGDSWVTDTLKSIPSTIGAYDSHRYGTVWGIENGVYGDQVRSRRQEINNLDSAAKPYIAAEVGMTALQVSPFSSDAAHVERAMLDPSQPVFGDAAHIAAAGTDSQPNIATFQYGVWMADLMIQGINAGLSGASAWDFDDAMHNGGGYGSLGLKRWGFFNSLGGQDGYPASDANLRPWYFTWSTLSRAFPAGSEPLVLPSTGVSGLRAAAARIPDGSGYDLSFAVVNDSATPHTLTLKVPAATSAMTFARYDYFASDQKVDSYGFPAASSVTSITPSAGITVSLPSSGVVVLTSRYVGKPVSFSEGTGTVTDSGSDFSVAYLHSDSLTVDHSNPAEFNYDGARITPKGKRLSRQGFIDYRASEMSSFELKAYFQTKLSLTAYVSEDGSGWWQIPLTETAPSPTTGGRENFVQIFSALPLPAGLNRMKLLLGTGTELAGVRISAERSGAACLATELPATPAKLGGISPSYREPQILGSIGKATATTSDAWLYCVNRGGELGIVFDHDRHAQAVVSTASAFQPDGIAIGGSLSELETKLGPDRIKATGHGLLVTTSGVVYVIHQGTVAAVAIASPALLPKLGALAGAIRRSTLV